MPSLQFPSTAVQASVAAVYILGVSLLAHCASRRAASEDFGSWSSIRQIPWARLCIILVFVDSWLFIMSSMILIFGVGLEVHVDACASAIFLCIFSYATSKLLTYFFLIEKVFVVWAPSTGQPNRLKSKIWLSSAIVVSLYTVVIIVMLFGRIHFLREGDDVCTIGLMPWSSYSLLSYDVFINIYLTALFLYPLLSSNLNNPRIKAIATRTVVASAVSLTTSTVNIALLAVFKGHELGWVCLGLCGSDVLVNALALFWVTRREPRDGSSRSADASKNRIPMSAITSPRRETTQITTDRKAEFDYPGSIHPRFEVQSTHNKPSSSVMSKMAKMFRGGGGGRETERGNLQVTVTTEYDIEVQKDTESIPSDRYALGPESSVTVDRN